MSNMQCVHETIVRDIVDIAQGLKDSDEMKRVSNYNTKSSFSSIASRVEALTLVFPTLSSRNNSYEASAMIAKAIERKAVVMLQMLFSAINISDANDAFEYIAKFHNNLDTGRMNVDKFIDIMNDFVEENALITEAAEYEAYEKVKKDLSNLNFYFEFGNINEESLDRYKVINVEDTQLLIREDALDDIVDILDPKTKGTSSPSNTKFDSSGKDAAVMKKNMWDITKAKGDIESHRLLDSDVKKANELTPTMMYINFVSLDNKENPTAVNCSAVIGIKAKLYAIDSQDIMNRLKLKNNDRNTVLNLIKAGTREISFFRDFIFAIDRAKLDALSQSRRGSSSKIWKLLERRAIKSKIKRSMFLDNDAAAISTLTISQEEVEYLKKTEYIDVENPNVIGPIMDAYNLMGFVILDESLEIAKFLFDDGENMFETLTFNNLEREARDNSTKKIINLMSKMSR